MQSVTLDNYIFVSYSTEDWEYVKQVVSDLKLNGYNVWYTYRGNNMKYDQSWTRQLIDKIKGCSYFLCFLSKNYVNSEFCMFEFAHAFVKNIIPIQLGEGIDSKLIAIRLGDIEYFSISNFLQEFMENDEYISCKPNRYFEMFDVDALRGFRDTKNNVFFETIYCDDTIDYGDIENFESELDRVREEARRLGYCNEDENGNLYVFNDARPLLENINIRRNSDGRKTLSIRLKNYRNSCYLEQKALRSWVLNNIDTQIMNVVSNGNNIYDFSAKIWTICGSGIWCITNDDYLIYSFRTDKVSEYANCYGYSAAGGFSLRRDISKNEEYTPFAHIIEEVYTELGVKITSDVLELLNIGVDMTRAIIQFSFFARIPFSWDEVKSLHGTCEERDELKICSCKATKENIQELVLSNKFNSMEPGAQVSLKALMEKLNEY